MKILGIETSTDVCGIALIEDRMLIAESRSNIKRAHAEKLIYSIDKVLDDAKLKLTEIDGIAISIGPGSFTGLRIGLAAVKGLSFGADLPVTAVSSLDALAWQAYFWPNQISPIVKAQADEAYNALYHFENGRLIRQTDYNLITLDMLEELINQKTLIINIGMKNLSEHISDKIQKHITIAQPELSLTSGYSVALLGYEKFKNNEIENIDNLEPFYLKAFKAKKKSGL